MCVYTVGTTDATDTSECFLPEAVREWAGLKANDPNLTPYLACTVANDGSIDGRGTFSPPLTFAKIAALIEANWEQM